MNDVKHGRPASVLLIAMAALALAACGGRKVACSDASGLKTLADLLKSEASKQLSGQKKPDGSQAFAQSSIRATLDSIRLEFDNTRTDKRDPDSDKVFCAADIKLTIPSDRLSNVEDSFTALQQGSLGDVAQRLGFERAANMFKSQISYSLQPTDDKKSMFAETDSAKSTIDFMTSVAVGDLYKSNAAQGAVQAKFDAPAPPRAPSAPQASAAVPQSSGSIRIANSPSDGFVALRSDPSVAHGVRIAQIPHGTQVIVTTCNGVVEAVGARTGHWCQVDYNGVYGWVFDFYLVPYANSDAS